MSSLQIKSFVPIGSYPTRLYGWRNIVSYSFFSFVGMDLALCGTLSRRLINLSSTSSWLGAVRRALQLPNHLAQAQTIVQQYIRMRYADKASGRDLQLLSRRVQQFSTG